MTQNILIDAPRPLTEFELQEVRTYAKHVATRNGPSTPSQPNVDVRDLPPSASPAIIERDGEIYLDAEKIVGRFAWFDPDKSSVDLVHEANEARARKYDKYFE